MKYSVKIIPRAEKEYSKLPAAVQDRIRKRIISLEENPRPFGSKKLKETDYYRIRIGEYRIIYSIQDKSRSVKVLSIAGRKEIYR
jgi:mRNA interferase RelE/StbE